MRVCLDTNVLLSGIFWKGFPGRVVEQWIEGKYDLVLSPTVLDEYQRVLKRAGIPINSILTEKWITLLVEKTILVMPPETSQRWSRDVTDDKFIDCSIAGRVDYLITVDKDLLVIKEDFPFQIVKPRKFLETLS